MLATRRQKTLFLWLAHLPKLLGQVVGVRGEPNVLFNPWVRWDTWPGLGREFFRRRRRRRRRRPPEFTIVYYSIL